MILWQRNVRRMHVTTEQIDYDGDENIVILGEYVIDKLGSPCYRTDDKR